MLIKTLKFYTSKLEELKHFYCTILAFPILKSEKHFFTFQCGGTEFTFAHSKEDSQYHYAIHIALQHFEQAYAYYQSKIDLLLDPDTKLNIIEHNHWNARAIYFLDPAGNIGEFIAHKSYKASVGDHFEVESIIGINEIGIPTSDVGNCFKIVSENYQLPKFSGNLKQFCAAGDPEGLFIFVSENEKKWFPTEDLAKAFPWEAQIQFEEKQLSFSDKTFASN